MFPDFDLHLMSIVPQDFEGDKSPSLETFEYSLICVLNVLLSHFFNV